MLFFLKKLISQLLNPLPLALILAAAGLALARNRKRSRIGIWLLSLSGLLVLTASFGFSGRPWLGKLEYYYRPRIEEAELAGIKWVVVLGGGLWDDPRLPPTAQLTPASVCRLVEGIRLWRKIPRSRLLLSGGAVFNSLTEAEAMAVLARELGVPDSLLVLENKSRDTDDQVRNIAEIIEHDHFLLVTSAAHLPRSMALCRRQGLYPVPAPSDFMIKKGQENNPARFFPNSKGIEVWETIVHEVLGIAWGRITGKI